jgi:hypothetical protein
MSRPSLAKLNWAAKHIQDLELACRCFLDSNPYEVGCQDDANAAERTFYLVRAEEIPEHIPLICGDALHNMRCALDFLAYRIVEKAGNVPTRDTCFPIADSAEKYDSAATRRKVSGMPQDVVEAISAFKPYKGGNDTLWQLHRLDARDKHHLLVTVGTANFAHSMTPTQRKKIMSIYTGSHPNQPLPDLSRLMEPVKSVRILKKGDALLTVARSELEQKMEFQVNIAFNEPGIIEGVPVIDILRKMKQTVTEVVLRFWGRW